MRLCVTTSILRIPELQALYLALATAVVLGLAMGPVAASNSGAIHVAFGDVPGADMLNFLAAVHRTQARGIAVKVSYLQSEDIAAQAVITGQADIGVGTPYGLIQNGRTDIRMFYQLSALRFYPIVNTKYYKTWADLDRADIFVHSRGSGTEAIMNLMAKKQGITYNTVRYLPGSAVRANAMLQGRIRATIVDTEMRRLLLKQRGGQFALLPMPEIHASDEVLYARLEFLKSQSRAVTSLLEELTQVWREINQNPDVILSMRTHYNLLPDMPTQDVESILPYYREHVASGAFPNNGGGVKAVLGDFEFYGAAGTLKGDISQLQIADFWYLEPLHKVLDTLGRR